MDGKERVIEEAARAYREAVVRRVRAEEEAGRYAFRADRVEAEMDRLKECAKRADEDEEAWREEYEQRRGPADPSADEVRHEAIVEMARQDSAEVKTRAEREAELAKAWKENGRENRL